MTEQKGKTRPRPLHFVSFGLLLGLHRFVVSISLPSTRRLARAAADLARALDRRRRRETVRLQIKEVFPHMNLCEVRRLVRDVYRWLFESIADTIHFHELLKDGGALAHVELVNRSGTPLPADGKGVIFVTGHFGWWEIGAMAMGAMGYRGAFVARPMDNPLIANYVARFREAQGLRQLPKKGALRGGLKTLKKGESLAFLMDQDARYHGIFVDFLGKPASTYASPAQLSIATGLPVAFIYCMRVGDSRNYRVVIEDVIHPLTDADREKEVLRITQRFTDILAGLVRAYPGRWLWLHRRWKTYPGKYEGRSG